MKKGLARGHSDDPQRSQRWRLQGRRYTNGCLIAAGSSGIAVCSSGIVVLSEIAWRAS